MESYKVKQNLFGLYQAYLTPLLVVLVVVFFSISLKEKTFIFYAYLIILFAFTGYRYFMYIKRPMEIDVNGDNIKMKDIFGKITECTFGDITDIEVNRRKELYFTIRENKIRCLNSYKDFDKFLEDAKKKNPNLKLWGFDKK